MQFCKKCGAQLPDDAQFCIICNNPLNNVVKPTPQSEPPQKKQTKYLPLIIVLSVVLLLTIAALLNSFNSRNTNVAKVIPSASPSAAPQTPTPTPTPTPSPTREPDKIDVSRIASIIAQDVNHATFSVCVKDLKTNTFYSTNNADYEMPVSALTNIPILYVVSKEMDSGRDSWSTKIRFQYKYSGRGNLTNLDNGSYLTLEYLLYQMLSYSDNNASNSLLDYYGKDYIESQCASYAYPSIEIGRYIGELNTSRDNYASARDITTMLADLYQSNSYLGGDYLDNHFSIVDTSRYSGIGKYIPTNVMFLNHNAITSSIYNEVAIIRTDNSEYVITVLSNNGKTEASARTIADISSYVYDALKR